METAKDPDWGWYATGPGVGIQLKHGENSGRLVIPCNHSYTDPDAKHRDGYGYGCHVLLSDDQGESWRKSRVITPEVNESQVVELEDGRLLMNMRSYHGKQCRAIAFSEDGGETWSEILHESQLPEPVCQAAFLSYKTAGQKPLFLFSNPASMLNRTHMTLRVSTDGCTTWSNSRLIYAGPSAYSSLVALDDDRIGMLFEAGKSHPYETLLFLSFPSPELFKPGPLITEENTYF
jgi:sialidase-1